MHGLEVQWGLRTSGLTNQGPDFHSLRCHLEARDSEMPEEHLLFTAHVDGLPFGPRENTAGLPPLSASPVWEHTPRELST